MTNDERVEKLLDATNALSLIYRDTVHGSDFERLADSAMVDVEEVIDDLLVKQEATK